MPCEHDIDAEYLHPRDATVMDIYEEADGVRVSFALECPDCGTSLVVDAGVENVSEGEFDLPLDDDPYD